MWINHKLTPGISTVYETQQRHYDTGLVDQNGNKIHYFEPLHPFGFVQFPELEDDNEEE